MARKSAFRFYFLIPLVTALLVSASMLIPGFKTGDRRIYDLFLHIKPAVEENESLLLLDIDDLAIAQVGTWPWSRSVVAEGLILLKEFEADTVVFDIEYVDPSPLGVDAVYLNQDVPELFNRGFDDLSANITALFEALQGGYIPLDQAEEYVGQLTDISDNLRVELLDAVRAIARDNDLYLGRAMRYFGNAWATINMLPDDIELVRVSDELKEYVATEIPLNNIESRPGYQASLSAPAVQPAILPVLKGAAGAGFPNVVVDEDGVRRRIDLIARYSGNYYGQLVFAPLLQYLGNPLLELTESSITVTTADRSFRIPLDQQGRMVINWPPKRFEESFRHLSYNQLVVHQKLEEQIGKNLAIMAEAGYLDFHASDAAATDLQRYTEQLKRELLEQAETDMPDSALLKEYHATRKIFFDTLKDLVSGTTEGALLAEIDRVLASPELPAASQQEYSAIREEVVSSFAGLKADIQRLIQIRQDLAGELKDAFVIIGHTGISTTDIGVNPFEKEYMNVGTHAAVANTILQADFLDELPLWLSLLIALILTAILAAAIRNLEPRVSIAIGLLFILGIFALGLGLFLVQGWYLPMLPPLLMLSLTFLTISGIKFLKSEGEKSFLRSAFSHYLSADVIKQLIDDPERLNLGGEKKELTAIFTDIKGFSTISEALDPTDLVKLLNKYLTAMSDTILGLNGTIDKYEGDAIIAFFGAPIEFTDHAYRSCLAAVQMKRIERDLNYRFEEEGSAPSSLLTRVGINTGDMVVGNMGTLQKMDYTIMGNSVNLAARLEGVNKQYGTWILMSEYTKREAGDKFAVRQLDRVRVVGINEPVRLFELIEEHDRIDANTREILDTFHAALEYFEDRNWTKSEKLFRSITKMRPEDSPSKFYLERIKKFKNTPPDENWDGVFNLTLK